MKRYAPWVALCAILLTGVFGQTADAQESDLTTTVAEPALEAGPVALEPETISAAPAPTPVAEPSPIDPGEVPVDWTAGDYAKLVALKLMPTFVYIVGGLLTLLFGILLVYIRKWTGIELTAKQLSTLESIGSLAWKYAEETSKGVLKLPEGGKPDSAKKLEWALDFAEEMADELGLKKLARSKLQKIIEAKLLEGRG